MPMRWGEAAVATDDAFKSLSGLVSRTRHTLQQIRPAEVVKAIRVTTPLATFQIVNMFVVAVILYYFACCLLRFNLNGFC